jgi:hypothetical protein
MFSSNRGLSCKSTLEAVAFLGLMARFGVPPDVQPGSNS